MKLIFRPSTQLRKAQIMGAAGGTHRLGEWCWAEGLKKKKKKILSDNAIRRFSAAAELKLI